MKGPDAFEIGRRWRAWWKEPPHGRGGKIQLFRVIFLVLVGVILGAFLRDIVRLVAVLSLTPGP